MGLPISELTLADFLAWEDLQDSQWPMDRVFRGVEPARPGIEGAVE